MFIHEYNINQFNIYGVVLESTRILKSRTRGIFDLFCHLFHFTNVVLCRQIEASNTVSTRSNERLDNNEG